MLTDEYRYKVLKLLDGNPSVSQRELARTLGISLGRVNYCLKELVEEGVIKASSVKNSDNKNAYIYLLTPMGLKNKAKVAVRCLEHKIAAHQTLQSEIEQLRQEVKAIDNDRETPA